MILATNSPNSELGFKALIGKVERNKIVAEDNSQAVEEAVSKP